MSKKLNYTKELKKLGISYLGNYSQSTKMRKSEENGVITYCLYLAPADMSGYNVCPCSTYCRKFCLNGSGHNKADILVRGQESKINIGRIKRTRLLFEDSDLFMQLLIHEIKKTQNYAKKQGLGFAVRLNGTSDLSPERFVYEGKNILQIFPDVQFYDYTKVYSRLSLIGKYDNYDLTFSYNGHNINACKEFLEAGGKVAVVFANQNMLPMKFMGYPVWDANTYDMRYLDPAKHIMGLHYHTTAANYAKDGTYIEPNDDFVVRDDNSLVEWFA